MEASQPISEWPDSGPWTLPIEGFSVNSITFGGLIDIVAYGEGGGRSKDDTIIPAPSANVRFESEFQLIDRTGDAVRLNPSRQNWEDLTPLFALRRDRVEHAVATADGRLEIRFESGRVVLAEPDSNYENWAVTGAGFELISMPGGGVARFPSRGG